MKITKKMYEEHLNALGVPKKDKCSQNRRIKKYGSWLRRTNKKSFDVFYEEYIQYIKTSAAKEVLFILKQEKIQDECQLLTPKECQKRGYGGNLPLVMIQSDLESAFIAEFIKEQIPKDKYFLKPCSYYMLGIYPNEKKQRMIG
ncbi:hypothetical protein [Inediibacterium massiliense]|uniref:hypothetical protein n=1 Tax=Inediibacterium massiliense TaxID=1658111 RepID=UPI0006B595CB|nr:hypothetical protein [Inediibacterium massiliense]